MAPTGQSQAERAAINRDYYQFNSAVTAPVVDIDYSVAAGAVSSVVVTDEGGVWADITWTAGGTGRANVTS